MQKERGKSKAKEDPKRTSSVAFKKFADDEHSHKRSTTAEKPKKKLTKKKKQEQEQRRLDEQQRRFAEIELQRKQQLEALRLEELKKLTKEEMDRLQKEFPEYYEKCQRLSAMTLEAARREKKQEEWERYLLDSEMIDVDKEKEVHRLVASLRENFEVSFSYESFEKWLTYLEKVVTRLNGCLQEARAANDRDKCFYYRAHLNDIEQAVREKALQFIRFNCDNFERLLEVKNRERILIDNSVKEKNLPILSLQTEKLVNEIVFKKSEERYKYEISRVLVNTPMMGLALWFNLIKVGYRPKPLSFPSLGVELEVPRAFIQNSVIIGCMRHRTSKYSPTGEFFSVGDVVEFLVYPFFPLPRINPKFILKRVTEEDTRKQGTQEPQPFVTNTGNLPSSVGSTKRLLFEGKENERVTIKMPLPQNFYASGSSTKLAVGVYVQNSGWTNAGVVNVNVDHRDSSVRFETSRLLPLSLLLPKTTDCPYRSFFLRCTSTEVALLDVETRRGIKLQFEIERAAVRLVSDAGIRELGALAGKDFHPGLLAQELTKRGIMVGLSDDDTSVIPKCKIPEVENKVLEDLTFTLSGFAFKSTPLNGQCSPTEIVVQAKTHLDFEPRDILDDQNPWQNYLFNINKCGLLSPKITNFREEFEKGSVTHINMEKVVRENSRMATEEVVDRFSWVNLYPSFLMNVRVFVKQLRLFATTALE